MPYIVCQLWREAADHERKRSQEGIGEPGEYTEPGRRQFLRGLAATGALAGAGSFSFV